MAHPYSYLSSSTDASNPRPNLATYLLGFFGTLLGFTLLPKALKLFIRKYVLGFISEIVVVVIMGLLTEKLVGFFGRRK